MARIADFQRNKVYSWERVTFTSDEHYKGSLTLEECKELAAKMYGARVVVKDGRGRSHAGACVSKRVATITLPIWARNPLVVAHEVAHIQNYRFSKDSSAHGGVFMWFFIELLSKHCGKDRDTLTKSARDFGLRVAMPMGYVYKQPEHSILQVANL